MKQERPAIMILTMVAAGAVFFLALYVMRHPGAFLQFVGGQSEYGRAMRELNGATNEVSRFYALDAAAKGSFNLGKTDDARKFAEELLALAPRYQQDWNYGNAIQDGNLVLGRIALKDGRVEEAKQRLLAAGNSPGSPQMDSFGPNMSLAQDLLNHGEKDTVIQYFGLCRRFWKSDNGNLARWEADAKAGATPDFGANLVY